MMTDAVIGKTREEALALVDDFSKLVLGEELTNPDALGDAQMLSGVAKFPARIKCATLGWKALEKALTEGNQTELNSHLHCD